MKKETIIVKKENLKIDWDLHRYTYNQCIENALIREYGEKVYSWKEFKDTFHVTLYRW